MIHQLLNLTRPLFVLDTETTGIDIKIDRIVEIAFQQWTAEGMVKEWGSLVNPCMPIPARVSEIHGITDRRVIECRHCGRLREEHGTVIDPACKFPPTFKQLAPSLERGFTNCDFAGQNVRFDIRILAAEFARVGVKWSYAGARIIDGYQLERVAVPRSLSHLHEKYVGMKHDGAHGALSDVRAVATVIAKQLEAHDTLSRDFDKLHEMQWPGWLCDGGEFRMENGTAVCQFGKWRGKVMQTIEASYWDWILKSDFPADVKHLAAEAKLGRFPK